MGAFAFADITRLYLYPEFLVAIVFADLTGDAGATTYNSCDDRDLDQRVLSIGVTPHQKRKASFRAKTDGILYSHIMREAVRDVLPNTSRFVLCFVSSGDSSSRSSGSGGGVSLLRGMV